ncbi:unnamed protein product, partial [Brassica oleracea]
FQVLVLGSLVRSWCVCLMLFGVVLAFHFQVSFGCFVLFAASSFG